MTSRSTPSATVAARPDKRGAAKDTKAGTDASAPAKPKPASKPASTATPSNTPRGPAQRKRW